ncbi:MAG: PLP-dependent aminotransferase family protein [Planctomycetaceae bacterium]
MSPTSEMSHESALKPVLSKFSQRRTWSSDQPISFLMQQGVENPNCISLAAGLVDPVTLPVETVQSAVDELLGGTSAREALQYGTTQGNERLRRQIVALLSQLEQRPLREFSESLDNLILTTGSQQLLSLVCEVLFDPGDICLVAAPTYFVFLGTLAGVGARAVSIESDEHGMNIDALEAELARIEQAGDLSRVKLIYTVDYYDNPAGTTLSLERRQALLDAARRWSRGHRILILEDAAYRELRYDGPELPSIWGMDDSREYVILAQTFSKSFSPGIRVGYGVVPRELVSPICDRKGNEDFGSSHFTQQVLAAVIESGRYADHVSRLRQQYRKKRDAMVAAAEKYFSDIPETRWIKPNGGLYVWLAAPPQIDTGFSGPLFPRAVQEGVMYVPGDFCFTGPHAARPRQYMRLSFGVQDESGIDEGMRRLSVAVRSLL